MCANPNILHLHVLISPLNVGFAGSVNTGIKVGNPGWGEGEGRGAPTSIHTHTRTRALFVFGRLYQFTHTRFGRLYQFTHTHIWSSVFAFDSLLTRGFFLLPEVNTCFFLFFFCFLFFFTRVF